MSSFFGSFQVIFTLYVHLEPVFIVPEETFFRQGLRVTEPKYYGGRRRWAMRICDCFMKDGKCFIACTGPEIVPDMKVKKIAIDNNVFNVIEYEIRPSFKQSRPAGGPSLQDYITSRRVKVG